MRILFLSHYFPPEVNAPASRTYEHCSEWVRAGHELTVVTCAPNHPRGVLYQGYRNRWFQRQVLHGINIIRVWTYLAPNEGFLLRTLNYLSYMFSVLLAIPRLPKAEVVISTSPQFFNGLVGYFVSRLKGMPWVLEIRDLWPDSITAVGAVRNKLLIGLLERLEMFAYRKADRIVAVTDSFKQHIVSKGVSPDKISVIKNGVDLTLFKTKDRETALAKSLARELGTQGRFVVSYVGTHGMAHHLDTILEAADLIQNEDILFLLVGDGAERRRLLSKRAEMGLQNVILVEQLPKEKMPALWSLTDVSLVLLKKADTFKSVIPSKIFESMAMEVPIILGVEGEAQSIIDEAHAGICIEPESPEGLAQAVMKLYEQRGLARSLGIHGRRYVEEHFDRAALALRYQDVLSSTVESAAFVDCAAR